MIDPVHPFARFGSAPYTFARMSTREDREEQQAYAMNAGLPYTTNLCGGSCDLCGHSLENVFYFRTAEGTEFKVGCDCAELAGEGTKAREGRASHKRAKRDESERVARDVRLNAQRDANEIAGHGRLTDDEVIAKVAADRAAVEQSRREASRHFGTPKQRIKGVELRYEGHYTYPSQYGAQTLFFLRTVAGDNAVIWKTGSCLPQRADGTLVDKGQTFVATFTVKSHGEYKGEQQTTVERLTIAASKRETAAAREQREADLADRRAAEKRAWHREVIQSKIDLLAPEGERIRTRLAEVEAAIGVDGLSDSTREVLADLANGYRDDLGRHEAEVAGLVAEMEAL